MDPHRFDRITRALVAPSRRLLLQGMPGFALGAIASLSASSSSANNKRKRKRKEKNSRGGKKLRALGQGCGGNKGPCVPELQCCNGTCKKKLGDDTCSGNLTTGADPQCCTGFCTVFDGCCKGPRQQCSQGQCCDGLTCDGVCCKPIGAACANANECCGDDTSCPAATGKCTRSCAQRSFRSAREAEECCDNPIAVRGETCCPRGSGNSYFCGRFKCFGFLTGSGPGGCDWWCDLPEEGGYCAQGVDGIPTGEPGRACCCTVPGTSTCVWP